MADVTIRELRNRGGVVIGRAARGERITITRAGQAVAELRPMPRQTLSAATLLDRWHRLPAVDPVALRSEIDEVIMGGL